ncbi:hypothetical protein FPV67DRAFT_1450790 [Lyophyllum atratum]|nr:hypothetical protein FPV67DRAFT_1450790 [Lyophyllum atratum]
MSSGLLQRSKTASWDNRELDKNFFRVLSQRTFAHPETTLNRALDNITLLAIESGKDYFGAGANLINSEVGVHTRSFFLLRKLISRKKRLNPEDGMRIVAGAADGSLTIWRLSQTLNRDRDQDRDGRAPGHVKQKRRYPHRMARLSPPPQGGKSACGTFRLPDTWQTQGHDSQSCTQGVVFLAFSRAWGCYSPVASGWNVWFRRTGAEDATQASRT